MVITLTNKKVKEMKRLAFVSIIAFSIIVLCSTAWAGPSGRCPNLIGTWEYRGHGIAGNNTGEFYDYTHSVQAYIDWQDGEITHFHGVIAGRRILITGAN